MVVAAPTRLGRPRRALLRAELEYPPRHRVELGLDLDELLGAVGLLVEREELGEGHALPPCRGEDAERSAVPARSDATQTRRGSFRGLKEVRKDGLKSFLPSFIPSDMSAR